MTECTFRAARLVSTVELVFTLIYAIEMAAKISGYGWSIYWSRFRNKFDGVITTVTVLGEIL